MRMTCIALLLLATVARAADLHVPGDWPSIQSAVDQAQAGDTILVDPGAYFESVQLLGKAVRIVGVQGAGVTTLDGGAAAIALTLASPQGPQGAEVVGLTITGGSLGRVALPAGSATLRRCRIMDGAGAGVLLTGSGGKLLEDCLVHGNTGGGVRSPLTADSGFATLERCVVEQNGASGVDYGGGVCGTGISAIDCVVSGNTAQRGGGGAFLFSQSGTLFVGNTATISGGGYYSKGLGTTASNGVTYAGVVGNHAPFCGGIHLDQTTASAPSYVIQQCLVADNTDEAGNLGFVSQPHATTGPNVTTVYRCTLVNNRVVGDQTLLVTESIVRGPAPSITTGGSTVAQYSDIEGGWPGIGTFDADPLFVDGAHAVDLLTPGSPCVDAGSPFGPHDPDGSPGDIGVASLTPFAPAGHGHFGVLGLPTLTGTGSLQPLTPISLKLVRARPLSGAALVLGIPGVFAPFKGGVLVPAPLFVIPGLPVDVDGNLTIGGTWPAGLPAGLIAWVQYWIPDNAASDGFSASNGLGFVAP